MRPNHQDEDDSMSRPWAIYIRVSTRHQAEAGFSLDDQKEKLVAHADSEGWTFRLFEDPGVSGERLSDRPGLAALLEAVDDGAVSGVLVVDESRLARDELVAAQIRDRLKKADVRLATVERGVLDLNEPTENFMANVIAAAHAFEQDLRRAKMIIGKRRAAEAGYWTGGPAPYGYRRVPSEDGKHKVLDLDEEEAGVLRLVADLIVDEGYTTYSAAAHLNGLGIRTRTRRPWRHTNLCWQLRREHTTGLYIYDPKCDHIAIDIPPVFTDDEWDALQAAIKGKPRPHRKNRLYPLTGRGRVHLRCACGGNFQGYRDTSKRTKVVYECARNEHTLGEERCPHFPRVTSADALESEVWDQVVAALTDAEYMEMLIGAHLADTSDADHQASIAHLRRRRAALQDQETKIVRQLAEEVALHPDAFNRALDETSADRITVEKELQRLQEAQQAALGIDSVPEAARRLVALAEARLADPTVELMAEVFDLLQVDLIRVEGRTFEGVARLPLPDPETMGEVWEEALPDRAPPRPRSDPAAVGGPLEPGPGA